MKIAKRISPIILGLVIIFGLYTKAYCIDLIKGELYDLRNIDESYGLLYFYGSGNGGLFFLDKNAYDVAVANNIPLFPKNGTEVSIVNNFVVKGVRYNFVGVGTESIDKILKVDTTPQHNPSDYGKENYLRRNVLYHVYDVNEDLYYFYTSDAHYFVSKDVISFVESSGKSYEDFSPEDLKKVSNNSVVVIEDFNESNMNDYVILYEDYIKDNPEYGEEVDNEQIQAIIDRLKELEVNYDELKEQYDLLELERKDLSEKLDIIILEIADFNKNFEDVFFIETEDSPETQNILVSTYEKLNKISQLNTDNLDLLKIFYGNTFRDEDIYSYTDEVTLQEQLDVMSKNITDSLQVTNEKTLEELNITLLRTNKFMAMIFVLLLIILVLSIALFIGSLIKNILQRNMY